MRPAKVGRGLVVGELVVSVLGKTVGRGWMGLGNSVGWGVVLGEKEPVERERR